MTDFRNLRAIASKFFPYRLLTKMLCYGKYAAELLLCMQISVQCYQ